MDSIEEDAAIQANIGEYSKKFHFVTCFLRVTSVKTAKMASTNVNWEENPVTKGVKTRVISQEINSNSRWLYYW